MTDHRVALEQLEHDVLVLGVEDVEARHLLVDVDPWARKLNGLAVAGGDDRRLGGHLDSAADHASAALLGLGDPGGGGRRRVPIGSPGSQDKP